MQMSRLFFPHLENLGGEEGIMSERARALTHYS